MAKTAKKNPWCVEGTLEEAVVPAAASQTWKAGEFGYLNAGMATPCGTDAVNVKFQFSQDQDTSTSASQLVKVGLISEDNEFLGFVSSDDADTTIALANVGEDYGLHVGSNYWTVNKNETSSASVSVIVTAVGNSLNKYLWATTKSPGLCKFKFEPTVLAA